MTAFKDRPAPEKSNLTGYVHNEFALAFRRMQDDLQEQAPEPFNVDAGTVMEALILNAKRSSRTLELDELRSLPLAVDDDDTGEPSSDGDGDSSTPGDDRDDPGGDRVEDAPGGPEDETEGGAGDGDGGESVFSREWF